MENNKKSIIHYAKLVVLVLFGFSLSDMTRNLTDINMIISLNFGIGMLLGITFWHESRC